MIDDRIVRSPFGRLVGLVAEESSPGRAVVRLPYRDDVTTVSDVVHGGAIATLLDTAATAAAWSGAPEGASRGTTIGFSVTFLEAARAQDLVAEAEVVRRGRSITVVEVAVRKANGGGDVARALVTYKLD